MSWREHLREGIHAVAPPVLFDYRSVGPGLVRLDCNELALPPEPAELAAFAGELASVSLHRYPEVSGLSLRRALARRWQVEPDVVDEAYADFAGATMLSRVRATPGLFVMRSLSKIGLAGLRLGALVGPRDAIAELDKVRLPWNVNAVSLALGVAALASPERIDARVRALVGLRRGLETALRGIPGLLVYPSEANFILVRAPVDAAEVFRRMLERGVLVKNVSRPGLLERCLRITVGTALENDRCVRALSEALETFAAHRPLHGQALPPG